MESKTLCCWHWILWDNADLLREFLHKEMFNTTSPTLEILCFFINLWKTVKLFFFALSSKHFECCKGAYKLRRMQWMWTQYNQNTWRSWRHFAQMFCASCWYSQPVWRKQRQCRGTVPSVWMVDWWRWWAVHTCANTAPIITATISGAAMKL